MKYLLTLFLLLQISNPLNAHWEETNFGYDALKLKELKASGLFQLIELRHYSRVVTKWCSLTDEYSEFIDYQKTVNAKREKFFHKCILDHSEKGSSIPYSQIKESCEFFAEDKYKMKMEEPPEPHWEHEITKELINSEVNEYYCHEH